MRAPRRNNVYAFLKDKILHDEYKPNDKLIELQIANELGVSRTPVREALKKLEIEGLVKANPRRSYQVAKISIDFCKDLYFVKKILEPMLVEQTAYAGITEDCIILKSLAQEMKEAMLNEDFYRLKNLLVEWNLSLINSTSNQFLKDLLMIIDARLYRISNFILNDNENLLLIYDKIQKIQSAIESRDCKKAKNLSAEYIQALFPIIEMKNDSRMFQE